MIEFRRDRQGRWAFYGPSKEIGVGPRIATRGDGQQRLGTVTSLSTPFLINGVEMRYGYIEDQKSIVEFKPKDGNYHG